MLSKIIEFFFGKPEIIQDAFFGQMVEAGDYYECKRFFRPTQQEVELGVTKRADHDLLPQQAFFIWLEDHYEQIVEHIKPPLQEKIRAWMPDYQYQNFQEEFELEYFFIPAGEGPDQEWELTFFAKNELQHWCSIKMKGMAVQHILIDG